MAEQIQKANSFDRATLIKVLKGAIITGTGTLALYILDAMGKIDFGSSITPFIVLLIPILVNTIREYLKGTSIQN